MNEEAKIIMAGMLPKDTKGFGSFEQVRRVYSTDGISPCVMSNEHGKTGGVITLLR